MSEWQPIETMPEDNADDVDARFLQAEQSVAVVGKPVAWVRKQKLEMLTPDVMVNCYLYGRDADKKSDLIQLYLAPAHSITATDLATLREKAAEADELRKDAERYRWLRENWFTMTSVYGSNGTVKFQINQNRYSNATEATIDAAIDAHRRRHRTGESEMIKVGDMVVFTEAELNAQLNAQISLAYITDHPGLLALLNNQPVEVTAIYDNRSAYIGKSSDGTLLALPLNSLQVAQEAIAQGKGE